MPARGSVSRGGIPPRGKRAASGPPRRRFGLRDARIRAKLGVILIIPILAIVSLTALRLVDSGKRALAAQLVAALTSLSSDLSDATHELQRERIIAAQVLAGDPNAAADYARQVKVTKAATGSYSAHRAKVSLTAAIPACPATATPARPWTASPTRPVMS